MSDLSRVIREALEDELGSHGDAPNAIWVEDLDSAVARVVAALQDARLVTPLSDRS